MRTCRDCPEDISHLHYKVVYCAPCAKAREKAVKRASYDRQRWKLQKLRGAGIRFCRCGEDISHRPPDAIACVKHSRLGNSPAYERHLKSEIKDLYIMGKDYQPERWPVDVLADRYQVPIEKVKVWCEES